VNPKYEPAVYVKYKLQGLSNYQIGRVLNVDESSVRRGLNAAQKLGIYQAERLIPDDIVLEAQALRGALDRPIRLDVEALGGVAVTADWHHPLSDYAFVNQFLDHAKDLKVSTMIVAGDWFNLDALSMYYPKQGIDMTLEVAASKASLEAALQVFDRVVFTKGNHDYRFVKKLDYTLDFNQAMRLLFADVGVEFMERVEISNLDHLYLDSPRGEWFVAHPEEYSRIPLKVPRSLSEIHHINVLSGHAHHTAVGYDKSSKYTCGELGGFFDRESFMYLQATTSHPHWAPGYAIIDGSGHLHMESPGWSTGTYRR
jgi:predicted phosphodiesterase